MKAHLLNLGFYTLFVLVCGCGAEGGKPRVDGHGDGEIEIPVEFLVIDVATQTPVQGVRVKFYSDYECVLLQEIEAKKKLRGFSAHKEPNNTVEVTDGKGRTTLKCKFNATFLWSFEGGGKKDVGTEVFPSGRFVLVKEGHVMRDQLARDLFPDAPYSPEGFTKPVVLRLSQMPNPESCVPR